MNIKSFKSLLPVLLVIPLMSSCLKNDYNDRLNEEADQLTKHIETLRSQGADIQTIELLGDKMYYQLLGSGTSVGLSPQLNDFILIDYVRRDLNGNIYFTNEPQLADSWSAYTGNPSSYKYYLFVPLKMKFGYNTPGFNYGVSLMKEGDTARLFIPSSLAFGDFVTIVDDVVLYRVIPDIVAYDSAQVANYLNENNFDSTTYLSGAGIYYRETQHGIDSIKFEANDTLIIRFKSSFFQEDSLIEFASNWDSGPGVKIPATRAKADGYTPQGYVPFTSGFAAAIDTLKVGTTATVLVPYQRGFGVDGLTYSAPQYPIIPPYTSLVYQVEVLELY